MKTITFFRKTGSLSKRQLFLMVLTTVLILFGTYHPVFSMAAFAVCCVVLFTEEETFFFSFLFYIMPMAGIFKLDVESSSLFTYLELLYIGWHLVKKQFKINMGELLTCFFAMYIVIAGSIFASVEIVRMLKLVLNVLLLGCFAQMEPEKDHKRLFMCFIFGILISSLMRFLDSPIFEISSYVAEKIDSTGNVQFGRYAGLYGDPNYYSVNVIIAMCLTLVLYKRREINFVTTVGMNILLIVFVGLTASKSAFLMLLLPMLLIVYVCAKNRNYFALSLCVLAILGIIIMVMGGWIALFDYVLQRLRNTQTNMDVFTTGRTALWRHYLQFLAENPWRTIVGTGGMILLHGEKASHNTYIDLIFQFGLIGTALYLTAVRFLLRKNWRRLPRNLINASIWLVVMVMYMFLSELQYYDMVFHIALACMVWNLKN